jgi:hypothetical protein
MCNLINSICKIFNINFNNKQCSRCKTFINITTEYIFKLSGPGKYNDKYMCKMCVLNRYNILVH